MSTISRMVASWLCSMSGAKNSTTKSIDACCASRVDRWSARMWFEGEAKEGDEVMVREVRSKEWVREGWGRAYRGGKR